MSYCKRYIVLDVHTYSRHGDSSHNREREKMARKKNDPRVITVDVTDRSGDELEVLLRYPTSMTLSRIFNAYDDDIKKQVSNMIALIMSGDFDKGTPKAEDSDSDQDDTKEQAGLSQEQINYMAKLSAVMSDPNCLSLIGSLLVAGWHEDNGIDLAFPKVTRSTKPNKIMDMGDEALDILEENNLTLDVCFKLMTIVVSEYFNIHKLQQLATEKAGFLRNRKEE